MSSSAPSWIGMRGIKRISAEFKHLTKLIPDKFPQLANLHLLNDDMHRWRVHVVSFDVDTPAGAAMNRDLQALKRSKGQDFMLLEIQFPAGDSYPSSPFFLRVVTPRCVMYTGHVTAGGSICIKALTPGSAADGCWQPAFTAESMLQLVLTNMIDCEVDTTLTASGGTAATGPLRIDMRANPLQEYSQAEADAAFKRTTAAHGWGSSSPPSIIAQPIVRPPSPQSSQPFSQSPSQPGQSTSQGISGSAAQGSRSPAHGSGSSTQDSGSSAQASGSATQGCGSIAPGSNSPGQGSEGSSSQGFGSVAQSFPAPTSSNVTEDPSERLIREILAEDEAKREKAKLVAAQNEIAQLTLEKMEQLTLLQALQQAEQQDQKRQQQEQASNPMHSAKVPDHWDAWESASQHNTVQMVVLPLPAGCSLLATAVAGTAASAAANAAAAAAIASAAIASAAAVAAGAAIVAAASAAAATVATAAALVREQHTEWMEYMINNGLTKEDAEAAIRHCPSCFEEAVQYGAESLVWGGAALAEINQITDMGSPPVAAAIAEAAHTIIRNDGPTTFSKHHGEWIADITHNGFSKKDAEAAVQSHPDSFEEALQYAADCHVCGGAAMVQMKQSADEGVSELARREAELKTAAQLARLEDAKLAEAEGVLARLEKEAGVLRTQVVGIERVQNHKLWTKFTIRRSEVLHSLGGNVATLNEHKMWHGTCLRSVQDICLDGFDTRVANRTGQLGEGNYFANSSTYSLTYCSTASRAAVGPPNLVAVAAPTAHKWMGSKAMLLCRVVLGRVYQSGSVTTLRKPPNGYDSIGTSAQVVGSGAASIYAVFDNAQAIPEYIVHLA